MKSLICFLVLTLSALFSKAQWIQQTLGSATSLVNVPANGGLRGNLLNRNYTDTTTANLGFSDSYAGAMIFTTSDGLFWVRNSATTKWLQVYTSGGTPLTPNLQNVTDAGNTTSNNLIVASGFGSRTYMSESSFEIERTATTTNRISLVAPTLTGTRVATLQNASGTIAYLTDIPSVSGLWSLTGNSGTTAGTNFIGTTDAVNLQLRTSGSKRFTINTSGAFGLGTGEDYGTSGYSLISQGSGTPNTWANRTYTASNGLTMSSNNVKLGGTLIENTAIDGDGTYEFVVESTINTVLQSNGNVTFNSGSSNQTQLGVRPDSIIINAYLGRINIDTLNNETFQNTLMGWTSTSGTNRGRAGYVTLGSGVSLSSGVLSATGSGGTVTGTGTANTMTKWTSSTAVGNALMTDDGTNVSLIGTSASGVSTPFTVIGGTGTSAGGLKMGAYNATYGGFWSNNVTPSTSNYALISTGATTDLNAISTIDFTISDVAAWRINSLKGLVPSATTNTVDLGGTSTLIRSGYFGTSVTSPLLIGGTGTTSSLTYKTTTGVGTTGADHIFQVGNNGATEAMRILNNGFVGIGTNAPAKKFVVQDTYGQISYDDNSNVPLFMLNRIASSGQVRFDMAYSGAAKGGMNLNSSGEVQFYGASGGYYLTFISNNSEAMRINASGNVGIGASSTISAKLHTISTTEQLRIGYDASNYYSTTVGSTGLVTFNAVGAGSAFTFSDDVTVSGKTTMSGAQVVNITVITDADYTVLSTDYIISAKNWTTDHRITLPDPTTNTGRVLMFTNTGGAGRYSFSRDITTVSNSVIAATTNITAGFKIVSDGAVWQNITTGEAL